jgi:hypothetical protein
MADIVTVSDSVTRIVEIRQRDKTRIISETVAISETIKLYKNGVEVVPIVPQEIPTPQNIIGTHERRVRAVKRPPRAILIEAELTNLVIAPLKLLAFAYDNNKAIVGIKTRPRLVQNVALSLLSLVPQMKVISSGIKIQRHPMQVKARVALLSSPCMWARARLKTRPESQSIHSLKAVNFEKMYKLTRIMKIAMIAQKL